MDGKEGDVIHGLKLAFTGDEIIRSLDGRLDACRAEIQFRRDEIDGKIEHTSICQWQEPVESVEAEILEIEQRVRTLTMFRERVLPQETYLLGHKALERAGLMPRREARPDSDPEKEIRWVTRSAP
jgi:hypothetical protein